MSTAYIDEGKAQAICCWDAPSKGVIETLFADAGIAVEAIQEVVEYTNP